MPILKLPCGTQSQSACERYIAPAFKETNLTKYRVIVHLMMLTLTACGASLICERSAIAQIGTRGGYSSAPVIRSLPRNSSMPVGSACANGRCSIPTVAPALASYPAAATSSVLPGISSAPARVHSMSVYNQQIYGVVKHDSYQVGYGYDANNPATSGGYYHCNQNMRSTVKGGCR